MKKNQKKTTLKKYPFISMMILLFLFGASVAQAQWGRGYSRTDGPGFQQELNLTRDQIKEFNDLQSSHLGEISAERQTLIQKQLETDRLFLDDSPDASRLTALQKEISDLRARMDEKNLSYQLKARKLLTTEQLTRVPSRCNFGFNARCYDRPAGNGYGYGCNKGSGRGHGRGHRQGCRW